jgi:hypothetical protein
VLLATDEAAAAATGIPTVDAAVVALVSGYDRPPADAGSAVPGTVVPGTVVPEHSPAR